MKNLVLFFILISFYFNCSYASNSDVDEAYEKWVEILDKQLWIVKKYESDLYTKILKGVLNDLTNGSTDQNLMWNVLKKQEPLMDKYIVTAPLEILDEFHNKEIAKMDYLIKKNRIECLEIYFSESNSIFNALKLIPLEIRDIRKILEKAILSSKSGYKPKIDLEKGELNYSQLIQVIANKYGAEFNMAIDKPSTVRSCEILNEIDKMVSKLDEIKRENVLRYLYTPD
ncbi:MAG: hypothetical protein AB8B80_04370 [Marinicellaceae bacterium]